MWSISKIGNENSSVRIPINVLSGVPDLDRLLEGGMATGELYLVQHPKKGKAAIKLANRFSKEGKRHSQIAFHYTLGMLCKTFGCSAVDNEILKLRSKKGHSLSGLLNTIKAIVNLPLYNSSDFTCKKVMRIVIEGIGSSLWDDGDDLVPFLGALKSLLRNTTCVCLLLCPFTSRADEIEHISYFCDTVILVEEFRSIGYVINPTYVQRYDGLLTVKKLTSNNVVRQVLPAFPQYGFKNVANLIKIEPLHMPPSDQGSPPLPTCPVAI